MKRLKIILSAPEKELFEAWTHSFSDQDSVVITSEDITRIDCDAVVSPANSFGFMDGGLDLQLSNRFGWNLEKELQAQIKALPEGELLVGQAIVLDTGDSKIPYLISAPTMRVPTSFNIDNSVNAYLAMKAILIKAVQNPSINSVSIPGLCTGTGRMKPQIAALQMFEAFKEITLNEKLDFKHFREAKKQQKFMNPSSSI